MNQLTKILAAFSLIILIVVFFDYIFGFATHKFLKSEISKPEYVMSTQDDYDIIFFGSSRAHHHYDTPFINDSLGINAFNAGEDGRGTTFQLPLITQYLNNNSPKLVVLEVFGNLDGQWNDRISMLYPFSNKYKSILETAELIDPNNKYYLKSNLFRYNSNLTTVLKNNHHPFNPFQDLGYSPTPISENTPTLIELDDKILPADSIEIEALKNILELCKKKNIEIVGVISPLYTHNISPNLTDSLFSLFGFHFIDNTLLRFPGSPDMYFKDSAHLNEIGARIYTKYFMRQITDSLNLLTNN